MTEETKYFSNFSDGTNTYIVKDAEARSSLANKQDTLVSGTNIKTINNNSLLGNGNITLDSLPSQSGNSGKFLTTNGSAASWTTVPLPEIDTELSSTSTNSVQNRVINSALNDKVDKDEYEIVIGSGAENGISNYGILIGAESNNYGLSNTVIGGLSAEAGTSSNNVNNAIAIGSSARVYNNYAIQLGPGINSEANSFYVALSYSNNYKLLGSDGKIPDDRLNTTIARTSDIPTVNNATLTIQKNSANVATFTANASSNVTANITVPTSMSDLSDANDYYTATQVDNAIASAVSSVYKPAGSVAYASLPTPASSNLGNVYNVTDSFTTDSRFVEGSGKTYPAGTNVVIVEASSSSYKFDVLSGIVDLSGYVPTSRTINSKALTGNITLSASDVGALPDSTVLPSIATTSTAGLVKPDGTSITIDANGVISSAAGVEIDNETITKNGDNELQTVAIVNPNTNSGAISPLKIWQGTGQQWNNGEATVWNYWQTNQTYLWTPSSTMPPDNQWMGLAQNNNRLVTVGGRTTNSNTTAYSTDGGVTWTQGGNLPYESKWSVIYSNNKFIAFESPENTNGNKTAYSTDGGVTWTRGGNLPVAKGWSMCADENGKLVAVAYNSNKTAYSTDDGLTWTAGGDLPETYYYHFIFYSNNKFIVASNNYLYISTDGGVTWTRGANVGVSSQIRGMARGYNNYVFVTFDGEIYYSSDDCNTWTRSSGDGGQCNTVKYGNGVFLSTQLNKQSYSKYSTDDGVTWLNTTVPSTDTYFSGLVYDTSNQHFVSVGRNNSYAAIFSLSFDKCYTLDATPTTSTQVYSEPETTSTKTITSVGSGTITLSDNLVYNSTPSGNQNTYRTLGDVHPDWLCNINNVGVKIGNTIIATAGGSNIEELTDSEIEDLWEGE